jgi:dsDNA-specific endonuclease/ATPase MutS2
VENKLDLHGIRHDEVDRLVENFVLLNETPLDIIVGNSTRMRELVEEVLERHKFVYDSLINQSVITVLGDK